MSFIFTTEQADFLSSDLAADILAECRRQAEKYAESLRIQTAVRGQFPDLPLPFLSACMEQLRLRERAIRKTGLPAESFYTADALEMASSAAAARLHASLLPAGGVLLDVAAGIGADAVHLANRAGGVICVESDPVHARFLRHNLDAARRRNTLVLQGRAERWLPLLRMDRIHAVFADPARRDNTGRHPAPADLQPPLSLFDRLPSSMPVLVKFAPGADPPAGWNVATVAVGRECSEQLLHRNLDLPPVCALRAEDGLRWVPSREDAAALPDLHALLRYGARFLIEPHAAIIRTGRVAAYHAEFGAVLHDPHIAYGWCRDVPPAGSWHRAFRILRLEPFNRKSLRKIAAELDFGPATELKKRGFPDDPEDLRRQLRLRGSRRGVILLTRLGDGHVMVFGERMPMASS